MEVLCQQMDQTGVSTDENEQKPLSKLFFEGLKIHGDIEKGTEPTNSESSQSSITTSLKVLELVIERTEKLSLFSINEEVSEISTANLKYLLAPAICGDLKPLVQTPREQRKNLLISAEKFLKKFLERCRDYEIGPLKDIDIALKQDKASKKSNARDLSSMNAQREAKIAKFKREKELEQKLKHLKSLIGDDDEDMDNVDDETARKYWLSIIEKWIDKSIENIESIAQEKEILGYWENLPDKDNPPQRQPPSASSNSSQPRNFILTRDKVQASVFGAGYPSLPTMTVEEWYESQAAAGALPDRGIRASNGRKDEEADNKSDDDDDEKLRKQRAFDDFKDTHRRGDGNRKNMG